MTNTDSFRRFPPWAWLFVAALCAGPAQARAQTPEAFAQALVAFTTALQGPFGDEGEQISSALDALDRALVAWDREVERLESRAAEELRGAPPARAAQLRADLGLVYLGRGRLVEAAAAFDAAAGLDPLNARALALRGLVYEAEGRSREAAVPLRRAWEMNRHDPVLAYYVWQHREHIPAELAPVVLTTIVDAYRAPAGETSRSRSALFPNVALLGNLQSSAPLLAPAAYADGYRLIARHEYAEGLARFRKSAAADPLVVFSGPGTQDVRKGIAALRAGRVRDARSFLEAAVGAAPDSAEARRALGTAYWADFQYDKSIEQLEGAVRSGPRDERSRLTLARVLIQAGRLQDAERVLRETIAILPDSAAACWWLSTVYGALNRGSDARQALQNPAALGVITGRASLFMAIATLYENEAGFEGAIGALETRVRLDPNAAQAHVDLARGYLLLDRHDEALAEYVVGSLLEPRLSVAHVGVGQIFLNEGRVPDAVLALERAVALQPANGEAQYALATALMRSGRTADAARHRDAFDRLQAEATNQRRREMAVAVLKEEAALRLSEGAHERSVALWQQVVGEEPGVAANHVGLAAALAAVGRVPDAIQHYERAATLNAGPHVYLELASLYERLRRPEDAVAARDKYERAQQTILRQRVTGQ